MKRIALDFCDFTEKMDPGTPLKRFGTPLKTPGTPQRLGLLPVTPKSRKRLSLKEKAEIIEESMKPGFKQREAAQRWGISEPGISIILKKKSSILQSFQSPAKKSFD